MVGTLGKVGVSRYEYPSSSKNKNKNKNKKREMWDLKNHSSRSVVKDKKMGKKLGQDRTGQSQVRLLFNLFSFFETRAYSILVVNANAKKRIPKEPGILGSLILNFQQYE